MTSETPPLVAPRPVRRRSTSRWAWIGVVPFLIFVILFIGLPAAILVDRYSRVEEDAAVEASAPAPAPGP